MENLRTRTEHSRSLEDAEQLRAISDLIEVGMLVPLNAAKTFHGRVGHNDQADWSVDPYFANGGNDSGNKNVHNLPTLYTGEMQVASDFAQQRTDNIINTKVNTALVAIVNSYSAQDRVDWLKRENLVWQKWYASQPDEQKALDKELGLSPPSFADANLDDRIYDEAMDLKKRMTKKELSELRSSAATNYKKEVYEIVAADTDASVFNLSFDPNKLEPQDKSKYKKAMRALILPITEGSPVGFDDRNDARPFTELLKASGKRFINTTVLTQLAQSSGVSSELALQLAGAYNAGQLAHNNPKLLIRKLLQSSSGITLNYIEANGQKEEYALNMEYVSRLLRVAHIVGVKGRVDSFTLGRSIVSVSFFDLEKVDSRENLDKNRSKTWRKLGELASKFSTLPEAKHTIDNEPLSLLLTDMYAKPDALVDAAKRIPGYKRLFESSIGNWEGFTLGEHTETVLRNFDDNFADSLPVEFLAPMRLALLAHDIGKPVAFMDNNKHLVNKYNAIQAADFLRKAGVDERLKDLLLAVIGDGAALAYQINVRGRGEKLETEFTQLAKKKLKEFNNSEVVNPRQIEAFKEMCGILQICDGGAYTSMAITRQENGRVRYRNAPSFNKSFKRQNRFNNRSLKLRKKEDEAAPSSLTPILNESI